MSTMANITYRQVSNYMIPNLRLPLEETAVRLSKWGMMYKDYLQKYKKVLFNTLLTQGKLYQHCAKVENQAKDMFDTLVEQMKESEGVTEVLKEQNQWEWMQKMNKIQVWAEEVVFKNLYTFSLECQNLIHVKFKPTEDDSAGLNFLARYY